MKRLLTLIASLVLLSSSAFAAYIGPVLVRDFRTGDTMPEFAKTERCEIYNEKVVLKTTKRDGVEVVTTKDLFTAFTSSDALSLVKLLTRVPLKLENGFVDGPKITYTGYVIQPNDAVKSVIIGQDDGDTGEFLSRNAIAARLLRSYIDAVCI